jgi:hypothetical protein
MLIAGRRRGRSRDNPENVSLTADRSGSPRILDSVGAHSSLTLIGRMRGIRLILSVVAVIGLAVPAYADPSGDDATFLHALSQAGITYTNSDRAIAAGRAVCDQLANGAKAPDLVKQLTDVNPGFSGNGAIKFAGIAASVYCPDQLQSGNSADGG